MSCKKQLLTTKDIYSVHSITQELFPALKYVKWDEYLDLPEFITSQLLDDLAEYLVLEFLVSHGTLEDLIGNKVTMKVGLLGWEVTHILHDWCEPLREMYVYVLRSSLQT